MSSLPTITATRQIDTPPSVGTPNSPLPSAVMRLGETIGALGEDRQREDNARKVFESRQAGPGLYYEDENGISHVKELPAPDSEPNRALISSANTFYTASVSQKLRSEAEVLRQKHKFDADGFQSAWREVMGREIAGSPEALLPQTKALAEDIGRGQLAGITVDAGERDDALAKQTWVSELGDLSDRMISLSSGGQAGSQRFLDYSARYRALLDAGVTQRWVDERAAGLMADSQATKNSSAGVAAVAVGFAQSQMQQGASVGDAYRAMHADLDRTLSSPDLEGMSEREREAIRDRADERFREMMAYKAAKTADLDTEMSSLVSGLQSGMKVTPQQFADLRGQYAAAGDTKKAAAAEMWMGLADPVSSLMKKPIPDIDKTIAALRAGEATPATVSLLSAAEHVLSLRRTQASPEVANIKQDLRSVAAGLAAGQPMDASALKEKAARLRDLGQEESAVDLERSIAVAEAQQKASRDPVPALNAAIDKLLAEPAGVDSTALLQALSSARDKKLSAMKADPLQAGADMHASVVGRIEPVDWGAAVAGGDGAAAATAVLGKRMSQARQVEALEPGFRVPPLTAREVSALKAVVHAANADQKTLLAGVLQDGIGEAGIAEISPLLFKEGPEQRAFAVAAELASGDRTTARPDVSRAIFLGQDILAGRGGERTLVMPKQQDVVTAHQRDLYPVFDLFADRDPTEMAQRTNLPAVLDRYQATSSAVMDYYAYLARGQEKPDQSALMRQSIDAVTGGVLDGPSGYKIFAPRPGMDQSEFDSIWDQMADHDFGEIAPTTVTGERITAADIRSRGILRTVGDGQYEVWLDSSSAPYQLRRPDGSPMILDLRDRHRQTAPATLGLRYGVQN